MAEDWQSETWIVEMERAKEAILTGEVTLEPRVFGPRLLAEDLVYN